MKRIANLAKRAAGFVLCAAAAIALPAQTFFSFDGTDGAYPLAAFVQATNRYLYGTTEAGGTSDLGTVFRITPGGKLTTLHSFSGADGEYPYANRLIQASNGDSYGTTFSGGANGNGTVFKMTPSGKLNDAA